MDHSVGFNGGVRRDSMRSSISVASDVEMARDEMFSGPMSESIPSSVVSFAHRRSRQNSTVSFTYFQQEDRDDNDSVLVDWDEEEAIDVDDEFDITDTNGLLESRDEVASLSLTKTRSTSRGSVGDPLLSRSESLEPQQSRRKTIGRVNQRIYIVTEDMHASITGFSTSIPGFTVYSLICTLTLGIGYLFFRWLPKWRVRLVGIPTMLRSCEWVAVEDQWNQFTIHHISCKPFDRSLSSVFAMQDPSDNESSTENEEDPDPPLTTLRILDYRYLRFIFNPLEDRFQLVYGWKDQTWTSIKSMRGGLDVDERDSREAVFGQNLIDIQQKSMMQLLIDEVLHPFYIFQIASLILWSLDQYYYYAVCIFVISVSSIAATIMETRSSMQRLKEISHFECNVRVLRNGFWRSVPSRELVCGDVYEISDPSLTQIPCDCLLLSGDCIINESMLTGESVPESKIPATDAALQVLNLRATSIHPNLGKHFLFCGTKIIRVRRPRDDDDDAVALAMVMRTGFATTKGSLIRSMLFPKPSGFSFYRDSFRYISVMGMIAVLGFLASFVNFIRLGLSWRTVFVRALDLITIVVPPALPATLTIGTNFALSRLRERSIFCISPQRVNVGGKLDVVCFDKTGTLTEDGLDVLGIRAIKPDMSFTELIPDASKIPSPQRSPRKGSVDYRTFENIIHTMATCHSLRVVEGELLGDPLDIKMFEFTGWSFEEGGSTSSDISTNRRDTILPSVARPPPHIGEIQSSSNSLERSRTELGVLRSFEFISHLRRTSVIVRKFGDSGASIFVKGAPECMKDICQAGTFPPDFDELLSHYTHRGYRVIACAAKYENKLSWVKIQKMTREEAESNLEFLGFIVFENKLKKATTPVIDELKTAGIRNIMCTGDNILTAISVARECGLMDRNEHCFIPRFLEASQNIDDKPTLVWESIDDPSARLDESTLVPVSSGDPADLSVPFNHFNRDKYAIAIGGEVFRWLVDFGDEEVLKKALVKAQVFARMSPDEKNELVEKLKLLDYCCCFCGDGANDCGALKAADVGISLSDAEASVAAPFTSRVFDISCVPILIKEGRAALVTSFCCFKYMSLYSAIQFTSVSFLYASASNLGDFQFLFIDLFLILPIAVFMGWSGPYPVLSRKRPTADLVSRKVLIPLIGQIAINVLMQFTMYRAVQTRPWFIPPKQGHDDTNIENSENTTLFLISCYQYIFSSIVLSVGPPFRMPISRNFPFIVTVGISLALSSYLLAHPSKSIRHLMQITYMTDDFKVSLVAFAFFGFLLSWLSERHIFPFIARFWGNAYRRIQGKRVKKRRQYKVLLEEMQS